MMVMKPKTIEQVARWASLKAQGSKQSRAVRAPEKPTEQRRAKGIWVEPKGIAKHTNPMVDLAADMIGALYQAKEINAAQEQAARLFEEKRAAYLQELGVHGFGSCLADNQQGYDGTDGNPHVIAEYRAIEKRIGKVKTACLVLMTEGHRVDLIALRRALDAI